MSTKCEIPAEAQEAELSSEIALEFEERILGLPKSHKHYTFTLSANAVKLANVELSDVLLGIKKITKGRFVYVEEVSSKFKVHFHGVCSARKAIDVRSIHLAIPGIQFYVERIKIFKTASCSCIKHHEPVNGCPFDCFCHQLVAHKPYLNWIKYCVKNFVLGLKTIMCV